MHSHLSPSIHPFYTLNESIATRLKNKPPRSTLERINYCEIHDIEPKYNLPAPLETTTAHADNIQPDQDTIGLEHLFVAVYHIRSVVSYYRVNKLGR